MALQTSGFFTFKSTLARFKPRFRFSSPQRFLLHGANFRFFLTEVLHQWDIAWADPGTGSAFNTIRKIMRGRFIVLLAFTEPVKLLRKQVCRAGVGAGATANAVLLFLRFAHFITGWRKQAVSDFNHRHVKPGEGETH